MNRVETKARPSTIRLGSPPTVAAALPHLLGFHPDESMICLWLCSGELVVVQRADLPDGEGRCDFVEAYLEAAANIHADEVVIVCVTRRADEALLLVRNIEEHVDVHVRRALIMCGGQVRSTEPGEKWHWVSAHERQSAADVFGAQVDARPVQRTRREVVSEVDYDESMRWELDLMKSQDVTALCAVLARGDLTGLQERRELRDAAMGVRGRDLVMWWCARVMIDKRRELLEALLVALRATPPGLAGHLACAAAATAWLCGDGVRANAALDRCLDEDPLNSMGRMLGSAMGAAVSPAAITQMLGEVGPEVVGASEAVVDSLRECGYSFR